ncbi:hypothetical protein L249_7339 [Ophiocordyceps polyrhachis-furcata BCC 54312]|uniref:Cysteine-rich transmembrane CYSTM domain-containing protein n=1 Tax=Ophiocordyceps polyrhachis-furcata BCC 54312 TaxID=1330021 RepID=A0A367LA81_9HYPO|nr:hypothetical protein L249_7339 [Ophiocordyceps polyrhachis-furcata BCC 54312]
MSNQEYYGGGGGGYPQHPQPSYGPPQGNYGPPQGYNGGYQQGQPPMQYQPAPPPNDSRGRRGGSNNCLMACLAALCCCCVAEEVSRAANASVNTNSAPHSPSDVEWCCGLQRPLTSSAKPHHLTTSSTMYA